MPVPSSRNSAGRGSVGVYGVGVVCFVVGVYLSTITRINLLTGHTSSPYLGIGIPLAAIGFIAVVVTQRVAKQKLRK
jgi:lipopolysaccharide export LptBFGC system permease protein LptF